MATITPSIVNNINGKSNDALLVTWALLTASADGAWLDVSNFNLLAWQATGTFGGATVAFEGSNDGVNAFPLTRVGGSTALTLTATGGGSTNELPRFVRPNLTTVGVGAIISATLLAKKL